MRSGDASSSFEDVRTMQLAAGARGRPRHLAQWTFTTRGYLRSQDTAPRIEFYKTPYGYTYAGIRSLADTDYVRAYHYVMPAQQMRGRVMSRKGGHIDDHPTIDGHIWVPIDDSSCRVYNWTYSETPDIPITEEYAVALETQYGRGPDDLIPGTFKQNAILATTI